MAEITSSNANKRKNTYSKTKNHRAIRVDLTPMVDLGFLLITFFVFTTTMNQTKVMNFIEPIDGEATPVPQSGAMTIILGKDHKVFYYFKIFDEKGGAAQFKKTDFKSIRALILQKKIQTSLKDLMYIIKADKNSTFGDSVDLLDELSICNIPKGHYSESDITKAESEIIDSIYLLSLVPL
ncbi:MAG: biopolymer transporter ExbD [Ferruginibacter sp.]